MREVLVWENHWYIYRNVKRYAYTGYTTPQTIIFILLGLITSVYPSGLATFYSLIHNEVGNTLNWVVGIFYLIGVAFFGFYKPRAYEEMLQNYWEDVLREEIKETST